jgi:hypothetical protein
VTRAALLAVGAMLVLVIAGCSAEDRSSSGEGSGEAAVAEDVASDGDSAGGGDVVAANAATASEAAASQPASSERVVYDASLSVRVDDPSGSAEQAMEVVESAGGSLADQFEDGGDEVRLTVRIPVDRFDEVLDEIADLGVELRREVSAEEVTDQIVDLDARLRNARASADRLRALFADANDVNQVVAIESALTEREAEVESLAAQLASLEDRADRSTLTVSFVDEGEPPADDEEDDDDSAFVRGLRAGWEVIGGAGTAIAAIAGFLLPLLPLVLVAAAVLAVVRRRRGRGSPDDAPPSVDPGAPPSYGP